MNSILWEEISPDKPRYTEICQPNGLVFLIVFHSLSAFLLINHAESSQTGGGGFVSLARLTLSHSSLARRVKSRPDFVNGGGEQWCPRSDFSTGGIPNLISVAAENGGHLSEALLSWLLSPDRSVGGGTWMWRCRKAVATSSVPVLLLWVCIPYALAA
jgi:hypothetical protein